MEIPLQRFHLQEFLLHLPHHHHPCAAFSFSFSSHQTCLTYHVFSFSYPHDTADFNRCLKVINLLSLSDNQIQYLANISKEWNKIIQSLQYRLTGTDK